MGVPVEDGFLRAMILTNSFSEAEKFDRVVCVEGIIHSYESIRKLPELMNYQTKAPYGFVPFHFALKRFKTNKLKKPGSALNMLLGIVVDLYVYTVASYKMMRGKGAGYW